MHAHVLTFVRIDDKRLDAGVIVIAQHPTADESEVVDILITAVTKWVAETQEGKELYAESHQDLNIGDLVEYLDEAYESKSSTLRPYLDAAGFDSIEHVSMTESTIVDFDRVLVNEMDLET